MLSVSNLLCGHQAGNERLRYGHQTDTNRAPRPVVVWAVTRACNLRCVHCYACATPGPADGELTRDEGFALLDDLKAFEVPAVLFSGGEPLARPEILDFIAHARTIGLNSTLSTNGVLIDDHMADRLAELGLRYVGMSIDGVRAKHDQLRGMKGAYDETLKAIGRCRARGLRVGVRFTIHALNLDSLDEIFDLCLEHDVQRLCVYHLAYSGRGGKMQKVDLTAEQTRTAVDRIFERTRRCHEEGLPLEVLTVDNHTDAAYVLLQLEKEAAAEAAPALVGAGGRYRRNDLPGRPSTELPANGDGCASARERLTTASARLAGTGGNGSGSYIAAVDPVGNVHYDQFSWHYDCGNVRERPFSEIWASATDPRLAILRNRKRHLPEACQSCRFLGVCNGNLRTRAEAATGDWLGMDPSCYLTPEERAVGPRY
jgi:radical SAM protein with 4Fe4S-binding SPASM domain